MRLRETRQRMPPTPGCGSGWPEGADRYLELFCQKTGMEPAVIQKWIPIVAAARSAEGGERERTFLLKLVNGEDYE